ncbi:hypothetical protein JHK87_035040 [Glycine soja]|nr:hypothetical protein JHK87_035040 [Glycine soja]
MTSALEMRYPFTSGLIKEYGNSLSENNSNGMIQTLIKIHWQSVGEDIIVVIPWEEWWDFELDKDDSNPHISLLPLHLALRARFNETPA